MNEKNLINLGSHQLSSEELTLRLLGYSSLSSLFIDNGISVDKRLRIQVLQDVLEPSVTAYRKEKEGTADDLRYRLGFFSLMSEYQLQNLLFNVFNSKELENKYLVALFTRVYSQLENQDFLEPLFTYKTDKKKSVSVKALDASLNPIFTDDQTLLDGVDINLLRPLLYNGSMIEEIKEFGLKYGVKVPKRLRKEELISNILAYFDTSDEEKQVLHDKLDTLPPVLIARFAKDNNIYISQDLKKEEVIEYILKGVGNAEIVYVRPKNASVYYFTKEQREQYKLTEAKEYVEEVVTTTTSTTVTKPEVVEPQEEDQDTTLEEQVVKETTLPDNKHNKAFVIVLSILILLQVALLAFAIYLLLK